MLYLGWRYKVSVEIAGSASVKGNFKVSLSGTLYEIYKGLITPGSTYTAFIDQNKNLGTVTGGLFMWHSDLSNFFFSTKLLAKSVTVQYGKDGTTTTVCGLYRTIKNDYQLIDSCLYKDYFAD
ncbi:pancreatic lipase-related protein 2-like [Bombina bombina]|uniref:pancreatic lipase-related protein 2-like n=1 Tax=Bombina bombina TaxID=8345 RepID=UPI00235AA97B|nr:pancreatic lipase-related protein 2-like [Bombina bombina]